MTDCATGPDASWQPSRFNLWADLDGESSVVYNSLSGALVKVPRWVRRVLQTVDHSICPPVTSLDTDMLDGLAQSGVVVSTQADERRRGDLVHEDLLTRKDHLHLILMPTEKCNFRCVYCYETFERGKMAPETQNAVLEFVKTQQDLRSLSISWFGGEPLLAPDVIEAISSGAKEYCRQNGIRFAAGMTTNGHRLTPAMASRMHNCGVRRFQVTLDGPATTHDSLRVLAGGGSTFETIMDNLVCLAETDLEFAVSLRVNYTPAVAALLPEFLAELGQRFGQDSRFTVNCHAVGHWGGPNDASLEVCGTDSASDVEVAFMSEATNQGFALSYWQEEMRPHGSVCYAANPRSFVIGSDGTVYKCTVAFDDPRNHVGHLEHDGSMRLDSSKHDLWLHSGEEQDPGCQACAFRPACQGNHCPLERIQAGTKTCPPVKVDPQRYLPLLAVTGPHR